jgi:hypothetical protein
LHIQAIPDNQWISGNGRSAEPKSSDGLTVNRAKEMQVAVEVADNNGRMECDG